MIATSQVGYPESGTDDNVYGAEFNKNGEPWCAFFISWCMKNAGVSSDTYSYDLTGAMSTFTWFKNKGQWHRVSSTNWKYNNYSDSSTIETSYVPQKGDIVLLETMGGLSDGPDHVGLVVSVSSSKIKIVEGNYSNKVNTRELKFNDSEIFGYCSPNYDTGTAQSNINWGTPVNIGDSVTLSMKNIYTGTYVTCTSGGNVLGYKKSNKKDQLWNFTRQKDGSYVITSQLNKKCLDVQNGHNGNGINVWTYQSNNTLSQKWFIYNNGNGYILRPALSDTVVLDLDNGNSKDGTQIHTWTYTGSNAVTQTFEFCIDWGTPVNIGEEIVYSIKNIKSGTFITCTSSDDVQGYKKSNKDDQLWRFVRQKDGSYMIISLLNDKCLDVEGGINGKDINIWTYPSNNTTAQKWFIYNNGNGYILRPALSESIVLDLHEGSSKNGTKIHTWTYEGKNHDTQTFSLEINWGTPVDLGHNITYKIKNIDSKTFVTCTEDGNVKGYKELDDNSQIWRFEQQSNGNYIIISEYNNKHLEIASAVMLNGTNISTNMSHDMFVDNWQIYKNGNGYILKPMITNSKVMDLDNAGKANGTNIHMYNYMGTNAPTQTFEIYVEMKKTTNEKESPIYKSPNEKTPNLITDNYIGVNPDGIKKVPTKETMYLSDYYTFAQFIKYNYADYLYIIYDENNNIAKESDIIKTGYKLHILDQYENPIKIITFIIEIYEDENQNDSIVENSNDIIVNDNWINEDVSNEDWTYIEIIDNNSYIKITP